MIKMSDLPTAVQIIKSVLEAFINFVYPPYCILCEGHLKTCEYLVCSECWMNLPLLENNLGTLPPLSGVWSVWSYDERLQKIIHEMKFYRKPSLTRKIGEAMAGLVIQNNRLQSAQYLIPVPLHKIRMRERGYNQSVLLAKIVSQKTLIPVENDCLKRIRNTTPQSKLNAEQRRTNVVGAFRVSQKGKISGKTVILIDDVFTTGATLQECALRLLNSGARQVFALTAARAD